VLAAVVVASSPAGADPIAVHAAVGMRAQHQSWTRGELLGVGTVRDTDEPAHDDVYPAFSVAIGYRIPIDLPVGVAVGVRAAMSRMTWQHRMYNSHGEDYVEVFRHYPLDLAATAVATRGRWSLSPWIGVQRTRKTETIHYVPVGEPVPATGGHEAPTVTTNDLAGGACVGFDVLRTRGGNVGLLVEAEVSGAGYSAIGLGIAYRR
jgi:hypothetical protein